METEKVVNFSKNGIPKKSCSWRRTFTLILLPWYALIGWLRLVEALRYQTYLLELNIWPRPLYFAITGALLGVGFSLVWFFLLLKLRIGSLYSRILGGVFLVWFWVDRIWFSTRVAFFNQLLIAALITAITLTWIFLLVPETDLVQKEAKHGQ